MGLLDADIHGPSLPTMMRLSGEPQVSPGEWQWSWPPRVRGGAFAAQAGPLLLVLLAPRHCHTASCLLNTATTCLLVRVMAHAEGLMLPLENHGVKCMSMGFFTKVTRVWGFFVGLGPSCFAGAGEGSQ